MDYDNSEIIETKDEQLMKISNDEKFIKDFKSIYYSMTAKPDRKSKVFFKDVIVNRDDLLELNNIVCDKLKQHYEDAGFSITVTVSFDGKDSIEFCSWQEFESYKFFDNNSIKFISIKWEYYAKLPQYQVPQRHSLLVKISDRLTPEEVINLVFAGKLENVQELDEDLAPIVASVDFINSLMGDELLAIVEKWDEGLKETSVDTNKTLRFLSRNRRKVAYVLSYLALFFIGMGAISLFCYFIRELGFGVNEYEKILYLGFGIFIAGYCLYKIADFLSIVVYNMLSVKHIHHVFEITKGDKKVRDRINKEYKKDLSRFFVSLIVSIFIDLICGYILAKLHIG